MDSRIDTELARLAAEGDSEAFAELVRRYRDAIYGYCYYRTGSFEDARDLCQEAFVLAYTKFAQLREADRIGGWLRRIAANLCNRWSERRREMPVDEVRLPQPAPESPKAALVREALSSLPDNERLAVVMHYVDGLSYSEIAGFLETRVSTVKGRLYRGREMLKKEVLKMTEEAFDEHKLDEDFILKSVRLALDESQKACWELKDTRLAREKADQAIEMLRRLKNASAEAEQAKFEALMRAVHATQDIAERVTLYERALDFGIQSTDPLVAAEALRARAEKLIWERDLAGASEFLKRARKVASEAQLSVELALCDALEGDIAFLSGDIEKAKSRLQCAVDGLQVAQPTWMGPDLTLNIARLQAGVAALNSLPGGSTAQLLYYVVGDFRTQSEGIFLHVPPRGNLLSTVDFVVPARLPILPNALPPFDLGWPEPDQVLALPPRVGESWSTETRELSVWYRLHSVIESDSESVVIALGKFDHCVRLVKRLSGPRRRGVDLERQIYGTRTIWFAPGVGIVKTVHEPEEGEAVTAELTDYHISGGNGYLPLDVGNWWRYRWVEGEETYRYQTQDHIEIAARNEDDSLLMQHYIMCYRHRTDVPES